VGSSKKKIISEETIETVEDTYETTVPHPPKKVARVSCDIRSKSDMQVCVLLISYFTECVCHVSGCL
jgi:hypothetical protein